MHLTPDERSRIDQCVAAFEARTGAHVVAAVVDKSDNYPEIPWKAFALGTSVAALALLVIELVRPDWPSAQHTLSASVLTLGLGAAFALATIRIHPFARLFLHAARAETEVRQNAEILYLRSELFATRGRNGLLILVSRFERRIVLLPDSALQRRIEPPGWQRIVANVTAMLAEGRICNGVCSAIAEAGALLVENGITAIGRGANELPDAVIEEGDADAPR
jgi:putative membrane protein